VHKQSDEIGELYASMEKSLHSLFYYVSDISGSIERMSKGDLRIHSTGNRAAVEYVGDYMPIKESMDALKKSLSSFFGTTGHTAKHVAETAIQLATSSGQLSVNTSHQAATIDSLDKQFEKIKNSLEGTSMSATETLEKTIETREELLRSNNEMKQMVSAMHEMETTSQAIIKIVKEIDDIAFLSSILSLNAAIEAARAGVHGKGFSVVADEVRDLAGKSAESAQYTETLIAGAIDSVSKSAAIAETTWEKIDKVCYLLDSVAELIENIVSVVADQAEAAKDIYIDLSNLNKMVQHDSAMSVQTTQASRELSQRMSELHHEMDFFKTDTSDE
jgi:methyl-accepting chemotaxis protein